MPLQVLPEGNEKDENKKSLNILLSYEPMASFPMKFLPKFPVLTPCPYWGVSRPIAGSIAKYYPLAGWIAKQTFYLEPFAIFVPVVKIL